MINITLTGDQINEIVVADLKQELESLNEMSHTGMGGALRLVPNKKFAEAIKTLLIYYMPIQDADEYLKSVAINDSVGVKNEET